MRLLVGFFAFCTALSPAMAELLVEGAKPAAVVDPPSGYVDDSFAFDSGGSRLVWVHLDGHEAAANVFDLVQKADISRIKLPTETSFERLAFSLDGRNLFATEKTERGLVARIIAGDGRILRSFGPAEDVVQTLRDGVPVAVTYRTRALGRSTRHFVEAKGLNGSGRVGSVGTLTTDRSGLDPVADFRVYQWQSGYLYAVGTQGGRWDPEQNQRTPDLGARYSLITRKFDKQTPILDPLEFRRTMLARQEHPNARSFVYVADGNQLMKVGDQGRQPVNLPEAFSHYDPRSLVSQELPDGALLFAATIDPVHPEAAARKRAVPAWTDLYYLAPGDTHAQRKARFRHSEKRRLIWRATKDRLAILPMHVGFDRGGEALHIYQLGR